MASEDELTFMTQLQNNPPRIIDAVNDLISWIRSSFGEPIWWFKKECWVSVKVGGVAQFGLCPGRYPDEPSKNRAIFSFRRTHGYEDLVEKLKSISPQVEKIVSQKIDTAGFYLHLDAGRKVILVIGNGRRRNQPDRTLAGTAESD